MQEENKIEENLQKSHPILEKIVLNVSTDHKQAEQSDKQVQEIAHFKLNRDKFYTAIHSFTNPLKTKIDTSVVTGSQRDPKLHLLISNKNTLSLFGSDCFFNEMNTISHPCEIYKSRTVLYQAIVVSRESKFTNFHPKVEQKVEQGEGMELENVEQEPDRFHLDILLSERDLPIAFRRFYLHRSIVKGSLDGAEVSKVKFQVSKVVNMYSFKYINRDIEKYISPLSMSQIFGNQNKILCAGKRHIVELDLETGKVKDVSIQPKNPICNKILSLEVYSE